MHPDLQIAPTYVQAEGCRVSYEPEVPCVTMVWSEYAASSFREANEAVLDLIIHRGATKLLGDIDGLGLIGAEDQVWLAHDWLPRAARARVRDVALVTGAFELHHSPVLLIGEERPKSMALEYFGDLEAGRAWLRTRP